LNRTIVVAVLVLVGLATLFLLLRPGPSQNSADATRERTIDLAVEDGAMTPDEVEVGEGDRVMLRMTSEEPVEIHLHGYDIEREVTPGEPAKLSFEADLTGRFEIENHESEEVLGVLIVQPR
jgi:FtsP/CotA-like multicopper oxidase with cupredoxin domain